MISALKRIPSTDLTGEREPKPIAADASRLAAAALLYHVTAIDGVVGDDENARLRALLKERFELGDDDLDDLMAAAETADKEAVDLYGFTSVLKQRLDEADRERIVEMMWGLVYADGKVHEFEDNVIWRVAELLGVSVRGAHPAEAGGPRRWRRLTGSRSSSSCIRSIRLPAASACASPPAAIRLDIRRPRFGDPLPETLADHAGAVIFGGPMSANDGDDYIRVETDWVTVPLREAAPLLGLCLGAQMIARHLGAPVRPRSGGPGRGRLLPAPPDRGRDGADAMARPRAPLPPRGVRPAGGCGAARRGRRLPQPGLRLRPGRLRASSSTSS